MLYGGRSGDGLLGRRCGLLRRFLDGGVVWWSSRNVDSATA